MPVIFKNANARPKSEEAAARVTVDVDSLVSEVKERLCLKKHERFFHSKRASPYQRSSLIDACQCYNGTYRHYSSPSSHSQFQRAKYHQDSYNACPNCRTNSSTSKKPLSASMDSPCRVIDDARTMLEKLLAEQSLIQEAVRRLTCEPQHLSKYSNDKALSFTSSDSLDTVGRLTPSYPESEDDSLSQHSVDL